jgi:ABC-2 type transport system ATP-binding protein
MIEVKNLVYEYVDKRALDDVSFSIPERSITALVGPNGAGKTTLLRSLAALSKPLSGTISVNGVDAIEEPRDTHKNVGYLSDFFGLYESLTVTQCIEFIAHSRLEEGANIEEAVNRAIFRAGVNTFMDKKVSALSRGMRQRVGIAQAIVHEPRVLLLDEPASGLDPEARYSLSKLLLELRDAGMTIIVSSHILAELEDYSTHMLVIHDGKMVENRELSVTATHLINMVAMFDGFGTGEVEALSTWQGLSDFSVDEKTVKFKLEEAVLTRSALLKRMVESGMAVSEFAEYKMNMQDEYIRTVSKLKK